ncbi:glucokinase [Ideonella sp.]|uniref:glucokinase n=1 Tax=Ideonella sp. TaxID=1929293 RepID=UPI003BB80F52
MKTAAFPRLVGDIAGTHARFAMVLDAEQGVQDVALYQADRFESLWAALQCYLAECASAVPRSCAIGIATPVVGDQVRMIDHHWSFSIRDLQRNLGVERLLVLNDFAALALALPVLSAAERRQIGTGQAVAGTPVALIGAGTGLGVAGLMPSPDGSGHWPISGEGGHVSLQSHDPEEMEVLSVLRRRFGHVSAERALSNAGLVNLHQALCALHGRPTPSLDLAAIIQAGLTGRDLLCEQVLTLFCGLLGQVTGNLALTYGARGGVYIGGGIVPRLGSWFDRSPFRSRFEAKGRFAGYMREVPTWVVQAGTSPALLGACRALDLSHLN